MKTTVLLRRFSSANLLLLLPLLGISQVAQANVPPPESCGPGTPGWPAANDQPLAIPDAPVTPLDPTTLPSNDLVGAIPAQAGVTAGIASYTIPIDIPPGRAGLQPAVSLAYSSSGGSGLPGYGWSLQAAARIHRCALYPDADGVARPVSHDVGDALCLNGQRLVLLSGLYGQGGSEYRTESETFSRIRLTGSTSDASGCFTVEEKSGRIGSYGACQSSEGVEVPVGRTIPLSWAITRVEDRAGNQVDFRYEVVIGQHRLARISYTGFQGTAGDREVRFHYEVREDITANYLPMHPGWLDDFGQVAAAPGARPPMLHVGSARLVAIDTWVAGQQVRRYQLEHELGETSGRTLLERIRVCTDPTCTAANSLPATEFDYQGGTLFSAPTQRPEDLHWRIAKVGDYDGDGVSDRVRRRFPQVYGGGYALESYLDLSSSTTIDLSTQGWATTMTGEDTTLRKVGRQARDFDGDGRVDIEGQEHRLVLRRGFRQHIVHHRLPAARLDFSHHVIAQAVLAVPGDTAEIGGRRAAQTDLDHVLALDETVFDEMTHRVTMRQADAEAGRRLIGMRIEMNDHQVALAVHVSEAGGVREHQAVAAADDDRDGALAVFELDAGDFLDHGANRGNRQRGAIGMQRRIAVIDRGEYLGPVHITRDRMR